MKTMSRWLLRSAGVIYMACVVLFFFTTGTAKAGNVDYVDTLKAGAALILDADITVDDDQLVAYAAEINHSNETQETEPEKEESTLVMAKVQSILNVRTEPNEEAGIAGYLYADCGGQILERGDGWTKIQSGNLTGWAKNDFLYFDEEAEALAAEVGQNLGTVLTNGLSVRKTPSIDGILYGLLTEGDVVDVYETLDGWIEIDFEGYEAYVSADYISVEFLLDEGETAAEVAEREAEEAAAKAKAEAEAAARKAALSQQQATVAANYSEVELLAALIWCEAGNQGYEGQLAVGAVVMNRVRSAAYPNTIQGVIYASGQFPPALNGKVANVLAKGVNSSCLQAAQDAVGGATNVGTATHFNRASAHPGGIIIGAHAFW